MVNAEVIDKLVAHAHVNKTDVVLDIGAGFGFLSRTLSGTCKRVIAVERDPSIARMLKTRLEVFTNVTVVEGDALHAPLSDFSKIVSIPPYQISSKLMMWLFERKYEIAVLILQREFADRLVAEIGSENYGWLTVLTYYHAETELLDSVQKSDFYPEPQVDSVIVRVKPKNPPPFAVNSEEFFERVVRSLFTQRNRKATNALLPLLKGELRLGKAEASEEVRKIPFLDKRIRELAPEDFGELVNVLSERRDSL